MQLILWMRAGRKVSEVEEREKKIEEEKIKPLIVATMFCQQHQRAGNAQLSETRRTSDLLILSECLHHVVK